MLGFDLETTGINVETDRIVTSALVLIEPGQPAHTTNRLANPGIDIPDAAAAVHGITTEHAFQHGEPPHDVILDTIGKLADAIKARIPIVGMNISYDLTLLDRECRRHGVQPLTEVVDQLAPVIDIRVLDKNADPFRKGSRKLSDLCAHYGVQLDQAHNSGADALAALRVAYKIAVKHPKYQINPTELHKRQTDWAKNQHIGFARYRAKNGNPLNDTDNGDWPIRPLPTHA